MMQKFRVKTFDDSIHVMNAQLMLIDEQAIGRRLAFEQRDCTLDAPDPSDERASEQRDDPELSDEKCVVMFAPLPARECGTAKFAPSKLSQTLNHGAP